MNNTTSSTFMEDNDLLYTIVCDLKRTSKEYLTAATEASCSSVRQMFTDLTNDTLRLQGEVFNLIQQQSQNTQPYNASRTELDKQVQQSQTTQQQARQFVNEKTGENIEGGLYS